MNFWRRLLAWWRPLPPPGDDLCRPTPSREEHQSVVIAETRKQRRWPRQITYRDQVPQHIREHYREVWRLEDQALLAAELAKPKKRRR